MSRTPLRVKPLLRAVLLLAVPALLASWHAPSRAQTCFNAYFEMQPAPSEVWNHGWLIPDSGTWTEIWPSFGLSHPQYAYADNNLDGFISHAESFIEAPGGMSWYFAGEGTMYHLTPMDVSGPGPPVPNGDPIIVWSDEYYNRWHTESDGRPWCARPDTLIALYPACCERLVLRADMAGGVIGNECPSMMAFLDANGIDLRWYRVDLMTCGLWVAPDLATGPARRSWGGLKAHYR